MRTPGLLPAAPASWLSFRMQILPLKSSVRFWIHFSLQGLSVASCQACCLHTHCIPFLFLAPRPWRPFAILRLLLSLTCIIRPFPFLMLCMGQQIRQQLSKDLPHPAKQGLDWFCWYRNSFPFPPFWSLNGIPPRKHLEFPRIKVFQCSLGLIKLQGLWVRVGSSIFLMFSLIFGLLPLPYLLMMCFCHPTPPI